MKDKGDGQMNVKKKYVKPLISFDSFEIAQSIASGCGVSATFAYMQCAIEPPDIDVSIFVEGVNACEYTPDVDGALGYCYHVPQESIKLFAS